MREQDMKETLFIPQNEAVKWCDKKIGYYGDGYGEGKQQAEIALYKEFANISSVTVRIPYVAKTERLYYYCKCIVTGKAMKNLWAELWPASEAAMFPTHI